MSLIASNIDFAYTDVPVLSDVSLSVAPGERVALSAPSGRGKTTLCKVMAGYEEPAQGQVSVDDAPLAPHGVEGQPCPVQMVWQHPQAAVNPWLSVRHTLAEARDVDPQVLEDLGVREEWMNRYPGELSGGEIQRICIARALVPTTRYLIADEITTMLDPLSQAIIWDVVIAECERRNIGLLLVSHDEGLIQRVATRVEYLAA